MKYVLSGGQVFTGKVFSEENVFISGDTIADISYLLPPVDDVPVTFNNDSVFIPGLLDVHVHLREPGFSYKETIASGTASAARGGFTGVCSMPNLNPVPDSRESLEKQLKIIEADALTQVVPYGAISVGQKGEELSDMEAMAPDVCAFSDDGKGVANGELMRSAMLKAKKLGKIIAAHCEDMSLVNGGYIHLGEYAKLHNHRGICSESEWSPIARDLKLAAETGCSYHVCHVSTAQSVKLIRQAKLAGVDVTAETAPHYLLLDDSDLQEDGRFKMNPPLRSREDKLALIEGICDGTIDMIATDHAPHSAEEKSKGLEKSAFGVSGLEVAFAACYTGLVKGGYISLEKLIELMHTAPRRRFGIGTPLKIGMPANVSVFSLSEKATVRGADFASKGKSTPFEGKELYGKCLMTIHNGRIIWQNSTKR